MSNALKDETNTVMGMATRPAPITPGMGPDEASAALAFATHLAQGMMPPPDITAQPQGQEQPQEPQGQPEHEQKGEPQPDVTSKMQEMEERLTGQIKGLMEAMNQPKSDTEKELASLKEELSKLANDDQS